MFKLNEPVSVESPYTALKDEKGLFEVVSPGGDVLQVSCSPGKPLNARWIKFSPELRRTGYRWTVTKISDDPKL